MSSFFRQASELSESDETSTSDESLADDPKSASQEEKSLQTRTEERSSGLGTGVSTPAGSSQHHQNVLVHALLEEKCLNDVCNELNSSDASRHYNRNDAAVVASAGERYKTLSRQLESHGLLAKGLEKDSYRHIRQTARDGLSMLSQQLKPIELSDVDTSEAAKDDRLVQRKLVKDLNAAFASKSANTPGQMLVKDHQASSSKLFPSHPLLDAARYLRDFEEVRMLGKGGYGSVFQCNHRLDGRSYAVKKIVLGPDKLAGIRRSGDAELSTMLSELRTMARLEHPNIVRYFGGWVEWSRPSSAQKTSLTRGSRLLIEDATTDGISGLSTSGSSLPTRSGSHARDRSPGDWQSGDVIFGYSSSAVTDHNREPTLATVTDEQDTKEIARASAEPRSSDHDKRQRGLSSAPGLTLHIQMSLYPLTLAQYLESSTVQLNGSHLTLQHCFHTPAAAAIMTSILDGVQYLHSHNIVHRDLKPANIFLDPVLCTQTTAPLHAIDPLSCPDCQRHKPLASSPSDPSSSSFSSSPPHQLLRMGVCVGDFGLASILSPSPRRPNPNPDDNDDDDDDRPRAGPVGTGLYRPPTPPPRPPHRRAETGTGTGAGSETWTPHVGQDIYALAIVFIELLCRFGTRMERHDVLSRVKATGKVPGRIGVAEQGKEEEGQGQEQEKEQEEGRGVEEGVGGGGERPSGGGVGAVVQKMLQSCHHEGGQEGAVGCSDVKAWLRDLGTPSRG